MVRDGLWHLVEMLGCSLCLRGVDDMTYGEKGGLGPLKMTKVQLLAVLGGSCWKVLHEVFYERTEVQVYALVFWRSLEIFGDL